MRAPTGRSAAVYVLVAILALLMGASWTSIQARAGGNPAPTLEIESSSTAGWDAAPALSARDGQREQAVRNPGDVSGICCAAPASHWKRVADLHATKSSGSPSAPERSRSHAVNERRANVALVLALVACGASSRHTTSVPPPHNA